MNRGLVENSQRSLFAALFVRDEKSVGRYKEESDELVLPKSDKNRRRRRRGAPDFQGGLSQSFFSVSTRPEFEPKTCR